MRLLASKARALTRLSYTQRLKSAETRRFTAILLHEYRTVLPDVVARVSTTTRPNVGADVEDHDCLFESVAVHSSYEPNQQLAYRELCGL